MLCHGFPSGHGGGRLSALSFPELPRKRRPTADAAPATARGARRLAESDEAERAPLLLTHVLPATTAPVVEPVRSSGRAGPDAR